MITDLVARHVSSYRQLPITLYQIQTKFRNEERPRFGVLRTSEFLMKDAYSFDTSVEGLNASYDKMYQAYCRIFERCGLDYLPVEAESGPIGGDASHEFMVVCRKRRRRRGTLPRDAATRPTWNGPKPAVAARRRPRRPRRL